MNIINSILSYFKSAPHTIKKNDVESVLDGVLTNIESNVLPSIDMLVESKDLKAIKDSGLIKRLATACGMSSKDSLSVLKQLKVTFETFIKNRRVLVTLVEKEVSHVVTDKAMSVKDASIIRLISDLGSMGNYMLDFLNLILLDRHDTNIPNVRIKEIESNETFGELYKCYGDPKAFEKLLKELPEVSTVAIDIEKADSSILGVLLAGVKTVDLPSPKGFVGNPFYHIGMILVDREIAKYENLKTKRELLALRLLELRQQEEKAPSDKLKQQIAYYEDKITEVEYSIIKIEGK